MSTQQAVLPEKLRSTFERFGVLKRTAVPKLDLLDKAISERKGKWELTKTGDGMATATVTLHGKAFDGVSDESNLALSYAFASALIATQPQQSDLFDAESDDDRDDDSDDTDPKA